MIVQSDLALHSKQFLALVPVNSLSHNHDFYPFSKRQIFYSSKLKELADDNFKVDENGRMFYKRVENTVGKGEMARYEQFLLFPQCFQKTCTADT